MKYIYFFLLCTFASEAAQCKTYTCTDITRGSDVHNSLTFSGQKGSKSTYENPIGIGTVEGTGQCSINGTTYPCSYVFTKVHPVSCTD